MEALGNVLYKAVDAANWTGRIDGEDPASKRWHQIIDLIDLDKELPVMQFKTVLLGFCCDEGVRRNQGRVGAKDAPAAMRKVLANLPDHLFPSFEIADAGDVICVAEDLEAAQQELAKRVQQILEMGGLPIVLGGGHEVTYGNYKGLRLANPTKKIGIINLDAHLDIRPLKDGKGNSGTGFFQIAEESKSAGLEFNYMAIGIQQISNTQALYQYAVEHQVEIIEAYDVHPWELENIQERIQAFADRVDCLYLTIDMDVFAAPYAPGVSALNFNGLVPDATFIRILECILGQANLWTIDIAELNPLYDIDNRTTKLAADLIFRIASNP